MASLAAFRVLFGALMSIAALRFLWRGWVDELLVAPSFHFSYPGFGFVTPGPAWAMHLYYLALALAAAALALGFWHRLSALVFLLGFSYAELIDQAIYLNHYYLVTLLAALVLLLPFGRFFSLDARRQPERRLDSVPRWVLSVMRLQVGVVYVFAGVAKLNHDWLFEAQPLRLWLPARADLPLLGPLLELPQTAYFASWFGALFDLGIVFLLLWRRTRVVAFAIVVLFHASTALLFPIGIFPWLMTISATLFFEPGWPRRLLGRLGSASPTPSPYNPTGLLRPLLAVHCALQLLLPLRQFATREPSAWSYSGFNFAWNVMVAEKAGHVSFRTRDRVSGELGSVAPESFLLRFQALAMAQDPALVRQAARFVAEQARRQGRDVAVYADAVASLNGRPAQPLIDPDVDLTRELPETWIVPLRR
ncbi:MAG: HTTM domain-containing protein [Polyangiaceae bacterium]